ncbi:DUF1853 family protein [Cellulophaga baltica]|uniref:DUF1853 domain-containing protein n=1 Tax=Cellulophaga baltica 18 TaxID=1348584 RepID=A0AAU8RI91_9FLAO|nr:DUF1853 family protein [Cellulophaga baltica]AIZ43115.1 hypothetical protein M666_17100 [Cellulophaga baltica 18]
MNLSQIKGFLATEELWDESFNNIPQFKFPAINLEGFSLKPIPENIRLGHQIEYIFEQLIHHSSRYKTLVFNQPIRNENRTLGELDFILQNTENKAITHVELTYKFYIIDPTIPDEIHQLIGPNRKDAFFEKIQKIRDKQFKLLQTKEAQAFFELKGLELTNMISKACFKAQLFHPYQKKTALKTLNENCIVGFWLHLHDFLKSNFEKNSYYLLTKQEWIVTPTEDVVWKTQQRILIDIQEKHNQKQAPMLWMKDSNNKLQKIFIVWW